MSGDSKNDRVPPGLRKLLDCDVKCTKRIVDYAYTNYPKLSEQSSRSLMTALEISCHGIPWISISLISIYLCTSDRNIQVNLLLGLIYDIIIVGLTKAVTRRSRPTADAGPGAISVDKFSFPSGHATRSVLLACFLSYVTGSFIVAVLVSFWAAVICGSRVIMRRHHVFDVVCGIVIGFLEWSLVRFLWVGGDTSAWIASFISGIEDEGIGS